MINQLIYEDLHIEASGLISLMFRPIGVETSLCWSRRYKLLPKCLAWLIIVSFAPQSPLVAGQVTQAFAEAEEMSCGPRAAFVLARLVGCALTYESVREEIHVDDKGCSIEDIKRALIKHGVQCTVRRLDITQLFSVPTPFIAHLRLQGARSGHFLIVNRVSEEGLEAFDPLVSQSKLWKWRSFSDWWTGYILVPAPSPILRGNGPVILVLGLHVLTLAVLLVSIRRSSWSWSRPTGGSPPVATTILILVMSGTFATPVAEADEIIRSNAHDGVNAASLLRGLYGAKSLPSQPTDGKVCHTLTEVQSLLSSHGVATSMRHINYEDLIHRTGPCIVPLRFGKSDVGTLHVVLKAHSDEVLTVEAGPLVVHTFSIDEFRRRWTGHALITIRGDSWTTYLAAAWVLIFTASAYGIGRRLSTRPHAILVRR